MGKFIANLGLFAFLILSVLIFYLYFGMLLEKIYRPQFKNLDAQGFVVLSIPIIGLIVTDFFIVRRFWKWIIKEIRT